MTTQQNNAMKKIVLMLIQASNVFCIVLIKNWNPNRMKTKHISEPWKLVSKVVVVGKNLTHLFSNMKNLKYVTRDFLYYPRITSCYFYSTKFGSDRIQTGVLWIVSPVWSPCTMIECIWHISFQNIKWIFTMNLRFQTTKQDLKPFSLNMYIFKFLHFGVVLLASIQ